MIVIGLDENAIYFEDPAIPGSRGKIPREEFLSRWHDYFEPPPHSASSPAPVHPGIFTRGKEPAAHPAFVYVA